MVNSKTRSEVRSAYQEATQAEEILFSDDPSRKNGLFDAHSAIARLSQLLGPVSGAGNIDNASEKKKGSGKVRKF